MIVFDMEWNSGRYERVRLNEILQISAVKVEGIRILDTFNAYIRPRAHKRFSPPAEALPALEDCLRSDLDFPGAMERFLTWCGEDRLFGTWGENDFQTLKENLIYWKVDAPARHLPGPAGRLLRHGGGQGGHGPPVRRGVLPHPRHL